MRQVITLPAVRDSPPSAARSGGAEPGAAVGRQESVAEGVRGDEYPDVLGEFGRGRGQVDDAREVVPAGEGEDSRREVEPLHRSVAEGGFRRAQGESRKGAEQGKDVREAKG